MADTCKGKVCPELSSPGKLVKCIEHQCARYQNLIGKHPQTGEAINEWDCSFNWTNILLIENAQETRQTAAAVESFRNESVRYNTALATGLLSVATEAKNLRLLKADEPISDQ